MNSGEQVTRCRIAQPQPMLAGRIGDDDMASVDSSQIGEQRAERARIDRRGGLEPIRCGVENDRDGRQLRAPYDRV